MLTLILWILALYGAVIAVWNVLSGILIRKQAYKTGVHAIILVKNGAEYVEGYIHPLIKGSSFLKRDLEITAIDLQSKDETLAILQRLSKGNDILHVLSCSEQELQDVLLQSFADTGRIIALFDLKKIKDPRELVTAVSGLCGK